ncbi:MAG: DUF6805 domain-containing protein [Lacipirellulaceae bacterium]
MPDNPKRVALMNGPTVLAADLGPVGDPRRKDPLSVPLLVPGGRPVAEWLTPVDRSAWRFRRQGVGRPADFEPPPFFALHNRRYTVYFDVLDKADWRAKESSVAEERRVAPKLAARTIDNVYRGEQQSEVDHVLRGERIESGYGAGRRWRHARDGGWFSYELRVDPTARTSWRASTGGTRAATGCSTC